MLFQSAILFSGLVRCSKVMASLSTSRDSYGSITTHSIAEGVVRATFNNPPINLLDKKLATDLRNLLVDLNSTEEVKVVIFDSANPDFFIAHIDVHLLDAQDPPPPDTNPQEIVGYFVEATRLLSTVNFITIAEVNGRAHGPGSEIALQCDMRFAGPNALFSQFENSIGIFPAAGAVPFLVKLIGRARTFEYVLAAKGVDAVTAEKIGWVNTAYPSKKLLTSNVDTLAKKIALFPRQSLIATKISINYDRPEEDDLNKDVATINQLITTSAAQDLMSKFIAVTDNFSKNKFELDMPYNLGELYE